MEPRFSRARQTDGDDDEAFRAHCFDQFLCALYFVDLERTQGLENCSRWDAGDWRRATWTTG